MKTDVAVLGAGITGLTAAYDLTRRGLSVAVFEASPRAGGLIRTERVDGFTIEAGPDSLLVTKPAGLALVHELGLDAGVMQVRTPGAFVLRGRELHRLPSPSLLGLPLTWRALAGYDLLPWRARLRLSLEPQVPPRTDEADESVASFFRRRFGPETVDLIAQPLLGGIHAGDIEELSMQSLFPRLVELERTQGAVLTKKGTTAIFREKRGQPPLSPFASLRDGMGTLVDALVRALPDGTVRLDAAIERLERTTDGWSITGPAGRHLCATLVLALPAHAAARLVAPIDARAAELCAHVPYVSTASVALAWPRAAVPHPLNGTGFVVARSFDRLRTAPSDVEGRGQSDVRITAATWVSSKWASRAPADHALIRVFLGGQHDPGVVDLHDDEMVALVRRDLQAVMGIGESPSLARVFRWRHAGAQHTVGHLRRVDEIEQRLRAAGGLYAAGSGFRSVGIPDCIADARRVAAAIRSLGLTGSSGSPV
jgi:oxygen-dependent protoporphyrinogen oxidase